MGILYTYITITYNTQLIHFVSIFLPSLIEQLGFFMFSSTWIDLFILLGLLLPFVSWNFPNKSISVSNSFVRVLSSFTFSKVT